MSVNRLSRSITSYDLLKCLALLLMVVDHIGYYFFPDELWLRVIGRFCVPIWFFFIGYSKSHDIPISWLLGGLSLLFANFLFGLPIFELNILFSMLAVRVFIGRLLPLIGANVLSLSLASFALFILSFPTAFFFEYGSLGAVCALYGYCVRNDKVFNNREMLFCYMIGVLIAFLFWHQIFFDFSEIQFIALAIGSLIVFAFLSFFKPVEYTRLTNSISGILTLIVRFLGRRTLEFYVVHLFLFKALGLFLGLEGFAFLEFELFREGVFSMDVVDSESLR